MVDPQEKTKQNRNHHHPSLAVSEARKTLNLYHKIWGINETYEEIKRILKNSQPVYHYCPCKPRKGWCYQNRHPKREASREEKNNYGMMTYFWRKNVPLSSSLGIHQGIYIRNSQKTETNVDAQPTEGLKVRTKYFKL